MKRVHFTLEEANGIIIIIRWLEQTDFFMNKNKDPEKAAMFFNNAKNGLSQSLSMTEAEWVFVKRAFAPNQALFNQSATKGVERLQAMQDEIKQKQADYNRFVEQLGQMDTAQQRLRETCTIH